jgi:hypothetical protein
MFYDLLSKSLLSKSLLSKSGTIIAIGLPRPVRLRFAKQIGLPRKLCFAQSSLRKTQQKIPFFRQLN